ncbi:MAG: FAD-dependent oxidoreductase [Desulfobacterales bacterium]|jgi:2,4-dienoyl-CoA reductase-like NADH-dependent reductase (Old Yellow Enzyme family)/thioredoxin reductase
MKEMFAEMTLGNLTLANRFVFPPIKTAYGTPKGNVTDRHVRYYRQIAHNGPAVVILEPVAVTADGKEHPKQLCIHLEDSVSQLEKIVDVIHGENRLACLHLNHAGAAANPKATGAPPRAPSTVTCPTTGQTAEALTESEIETIIEGYRVAAEKAVAAGFDMIEVQGGHGYLVSQFLNEKINQRTDRYGDNRRLFAERVISAIKAGAPGVPCMLRISGSEMSPEYGIGQKDLAPLFGLAEAAGICAVHVGMGSACFSPPWYFHHARLPEQPQLDALAWVRKQTRLPIVAAGRMGRIEKAARVLEGRLADLIALGRPLIADPDLIEKWEKEAFEEVKSCGYCLQGCLHRVKNGEPIGCNINPEIGEAEIGKTDRPLRVLVAGGGPAGMSASLYLSRRGHRVTLMEKEDRLGGQFNLAWQAPGKQAMRDGLDHLASCAMADCAAVVFGRNVDVAAVKEISPDLLVWSVGAEQNIPAFDGLDTQNALTAIDYFRGKPVSGPRILVVGAGRSGLEIAEKLGAEGLEVTATKRTDPIGSMMEMITRKLTLMRIDQMPNVTLMPHTTVKAFTADGVEVEQDGQKIHLAPFQTVILASGMTSAAGPDAQIEAAVPAVEKIGDADNVMDIYSAVHAGYQLALRY